MFARNRRGASLLEVMAAASLSLLALSVLLSVVRPAFQATGQSSARIDMEQQAIVVLQKLTQELQRTTSTGVATINPTTGTVISVHPIVGVTASDPPQQIFAQKLTFYVYSQTRRTIRRSVWPEDTAHPVLFDQKLKPPDGQVAVHPLDSSLQAVLDNSPRGQQLACDVTRFELTSAVAGSIVSPLTATIELQRKLPGRQQPTVFQLAQVISLRNSE